MCKSLLPFPSLLVLFYLILFKRSRGPTCRHEFLSGMWKCATLPLRYVNRLYYHPPERLQCVFVCSAERRGARLYYIRCSYVQRFRIICGSWRFIRISTSSGSGFVVVVRLRDSSAEYENQYLRHSKLVWPSFNCGAQKTLNWRCFLSSWGMHWELPWKFWMRSSRQHLKTWDILHF